MKVQKLGRMTLMLGITGILLLALFNGVTAQELIFEEDFSDPISDGWEYMGTNWTLYQSDGPVEAVEHDYAVINSTLVNDKTNPERQIADYASHEVSIREGIWEFDAETHDEGSDMIWGFYLFETDMDYIGEDPATIAQRGFYVFFDRNVDDGSPTIHALEIDTEKYKKTTDKPLAEELRTLNVTRHYTFEVSLEKVEVYINSQSVMNHTFMYDYESFNYFGVYTRMASTFDNFVVTETESTTSILNSPATYIIAFGALIAIGGIGYSQKKRIRRLIHSVKTKFIPQQLELAQLQKEMDILFRQQSILYSLVTAANRPVDIDKDLKKIELPTDIYQYRFLMHPVRLTMMKILHNFQKLSSVEIKTMLKLSWSQYNNNIKALEEKKYIKIQDEFEGEMKRQFVYMLPDGMNDYEALSKLLEELIANPVLMETLETMKESDEFLYPNK